MDKVSILIPCYNVEQFIPSCLDSILNQSYDDLQIVLIDDGSKDGSWAIMRRYAKLDERIEIYHQENYGVAYTRNKLLEKVNGDFVLFVDSDDWIEPNMVESLITKAIQYEADVVTCGMIINDSTPSPTYTETLLDRTETIKKFLFHKDLKGSLWNKLIKTNLLHNLSFDPSIGYGEDALFCWQIFQGVDKVVLTDKQLYHYRMNDSSISHSSFGKQKLTGNKVWKRITDDTASSWPEFLYISQARWGMESYYLLLQASFGGYSKDEEIKNLQTNVKSLFPLMKSAGLLHGKELISARLISHWYGYGRTYMALHKLKKTFKCL